MNKEDKLNDTFAYVHDTLVHTKKFDYMEAIDLAEKITKHVENRYT